MAQYLHFFDPDRKSGSYLRKDLKNDVLYGFFRYKELNITFAKKSGVATRVNDSLAKALLQKGLITQEQLNAYLQQATGLFATYQMVESYDNHTLESIYALVCGIRKDILGAEVLEQAKAADMDLEACLDTQGCLDQRKRIDAMLQHSNAVIFALCESALFSCFYEDLLGLKHKQIYVLVSSQPGQTLPTRHTLRQKLESFTNIQYLSADAGIAYDAQLQQLIDAGKASLMVYGEEGLLHCRSLTIDAAVCAIPRGYYAQALTNQLGLVRGCRVFIPRHFDITPWVRLKERTRLSYGQLARLQEVYGDEIYKLSVPELYMRYPQYFINIYENGSAFQESPLAVTMRPSADPLTQFDSQREQAIGNYLNGFSNLSYSSAYFDENLKPAPMGTDPSQKQPGVLVHAVRVKRAKSARVIRCDKGKTLRQMFAKNEAGIVSNFLFFMTGKLATLYNDLRADRPLEQANVATGHLDYMLCYRDGQRIETFPLFRKTCIAMQENGEFLFFNFRLGGGSIRFGTHQLRWESDQVDGGFDGPICVHTPYSSLTDQDADRQTYRKLVGQNRVNLVILQDRIHALRKGDVVLPSVGVVISLDEATAAPVLQQLKPIGDGYYDVSELNMRLQLDPPQGICPETWQQVRWAYGGGLSLILDSVGLCDGDHMDAWFAADGWKSPLSRQTQESTLHELVKHPRTAIGILENGDLVILVFSGRTWRSSGADYRQMCAIARSMFGNVQYLMNMDGGGSAVLGMVTGGSFMELSCPSTSTGSCVGMVRPINTVLFIPAQKEDIV